MNIAVYTDGACSNNPGIGGWGVVILKNNKETVCLNGGMINTTNNQMELTATINALKYFKTSTNIKGRSKRPAFSNFRNIITTMEVQL